MSPLLISDEDVRRLLSPQAAVAAMRAALAAVRAGGLDAPPRVHADLGEGRLTFTVGRLRDQGLFGFRAYDTLVGGEQLTAVWSSADGALVAVVHGDELGARRTGGIGAVAVDVAARSGPICLGIVGAGVQAWTQLWAITAVRQIDRLVVAGRSSERAQDFVRRAAQELGLDARLGTPEQAVRDQDVVITATNSPAPVFEAGWLAPGTHLNTVGPKTRARHEVPADLADRADVLFTDSPAQAAGYAEPHILPADRMLDLADIVTGSTPGRTAPDQVTVFCSVGLAGTEVALAAAVAKVATRPD